MRMRKLVLEFGFIHSGRESFFVFQVEMSKNEEPHKRLSKKEGKLLKDTYDTMILYCKDPWHCM